MHHRLISEVTRIASDDYIPTEADVVLMQARDFYEIAFVVEPTPIPRMSPFRIGERAMPMRITNIGCRTPNLNPLIASQIASVDVLVFLVNLANYDQGTETNELLRYMEYLQSVSDLHNRLGHEYLPVMLLLTHEKEFREKLARVPLAKYFPDYDGGPDSERATDYIAKRFRSIEYSYVQTTGTVATEADLERMLTSIKKSFIAKATLQNLERVFQKNC
jgi:guanine nucleotide-binding protein G(i) subunit alpha